METAPRVLKEIQWLRQNNWQVETLGFGSTPAGVTAHHRVRQPAAVTRFASYLLPSALRFGLSLGSRFLRALRTIQAKNYEMIILHDPDLAPLGRVINEMVQSSGGRLHIDLHEEHSSSLGRTKLESLVFDRYNLWRLIQLDSLVRSNRSVTISTCADNISEVFGLRWGIDVFTIRNTPPFVELNPSEISDRIELVHHGVGTRDRFIEEYIEALVDLPDDFELHFYLKATKGYISGLRRLVRILNLDSRVTFHDPVPTQELAKSINRHDVGLVVIPPVTVNEVKALPNKLFESIQARLAVVTGPNQNMASIVSGHSVGIVLDTWSKEALVEGLLSLSRSEIQRFKFSSHTSSLLLSSEEDARLFLSRVTGAIDS